MGAVAPDLSLNTAVSFVTNTNWQNYGGESTLSYLTQMLGLTVQNFLSAATGMAILISFVRAFVRHNTRLLGNFWVDLTRSTLYILLPLAILVALVLVSQGAVQTVSPSVTVQLIQP
jgi:K+-transporting ATPase ATPase A chain